MSTSCSTCSNNSLCVFKYAAYTPFLNGCLFSTCWLFRLFRLLFFDLLWICGLDLKNYAVADFKNYEVANLRLRTSGITWLRTSGITWLRTSGITWLRTCGCGLQELRGCELAVADFRNYVVANLWLRTSGITWLQTCGYEFNNSETSLRTSNQNQVFHYTHCNTPKRVTSWRGPSPRHCARATQLLSKKCCIGGEP